ncbi:hypothetical protein OAS86_06120 [Gammaproteobacteria bacterium]|nr:hypothetical protein [Gammaproteobacteria bacterium]
MRWVFLGLIALLVFIIGNRLGLRRSLSITASVIAAAAVAAILAITERDDDQAWLDELEHSLTVQSLDVEPGRDGSVVISTLIDNAHADYYLVAINGELAIDQCVGSDCEPWERRQVRLQTAIAPASQARSRNSVTYSRVPTPRPNQRLEATFTINAVEGQRSTRSNR